MHNNISGIFKLKAIPVIVQIIRELEQQSSNRRGGKKREEILNDCSLICFTCFNFVKRQFPQNQKRNY